NTSANVDLIEFAELTEAQQKAARREVLAEIALCKKKFAYLDMSAVDFRIVKRLAKQHYTKAQIATALELFTDYKDRHVDHVDYLTRTINNAFEEI
ncbi:DNA primase, partial [[Haemophilus] felis]|nr:DNA primase [[Haemophilus] felis]